MTFKDSYILLRDLRFYAYHGVLPQENVVGSYFLVTARIQVNLMKAAETDELSDTVSYADLYQCIQETMAVPCKLLEHVAYNISRRLYEQFPAIELISLTVKKENAPLGNGAQGMAGISLKTTR